MKLKFVLILMLAATMFLLSAPSYAGIVEDQLAKQALLDLKNVIKSIKPFEPSIARRLNVRKKILLDGLKGKLKCTPSGAQAITDTLLNLGDKILEKQCTDEASNRTFTPKFNHCTSAADLKCVCSHKQHKNDPQCIACLGSKEEKDKDCIPTDIAQDAVNRINQIATNITTAFSVDSDGNGQSDVCEDNL